MFLNESRARTAERCLRQFYWFFLYGGNGLALVRPNKAMTWGILLHAGLAAHYQHNGDLGMVRFALEAALKEEFPNFEALDYSTKNEWLEELDWIEKVVGRYQQWAQAEDNFNVEGVEQSGAVVLGESCWQCGKPYVNYGDVKGVPTCPACAADAHQFVFRLDLLVRDDYGFRVIDHKSTSSGVDEHYLKTWDFSSQLWGYCYGAEKQGGHPIGSYAINIIRKVNAAGEEPDLTKACPDCKNGSKKKLSCSGCNGEGRVARPPRAADSPFHRENFSFTPAKRNWFVESRVRIANKITEHTRRLAEGDPSAFPRNPSACFSCPLTDLCYQPNATKLDEIFVPEEKYLLKSEDYVTLKKLASEEAS